MPFKTNKISLSINMRKLNIWSAISLRLDGLIGYLERHSERHFQIKTPANFTFFKSRINENLLTLVKTLTYQINPTYSYDKSSIYYLCKY